MTHYQLLLAGATVVLVLSACQTQATPAPASAATAPQTTASAPASSVPDGDQAAEPTPRKIDALMSLSMIGVTKEFLERTTGQSTYETPDTASYKVDGCDVSAGISNRAVTSITVQLKPGCTFDARELAASDRPTVVDGTLTFAQFEKLFGTANYTSPCIRLCGNAFDPYVDAVVPGYHANGGIDVAATVAFVDDEAISASSAWASALDKVEGETYVDARKFNCERSHDDIPRAQFANVRAESLQFGRDLGTSECD